MPSRSLWLLCSIPMLTLAACRGKPPAAPVPLGDCPPPLQWKPGEPRPRGVRVVNRTEETLLVYIDRCRGHDRIGAVRPGRERLYRLPDRLVPVRGGLTFHAFLRETVRYHSSTTLQPDSSAVLVLEISPRTEPPCEPVVYVDGERHDGALSDFPVDRIANMTVREPSDPAGCREYHIELRG